MNFFGVLSLKKKLKNKIKLWLKYVDDAYTIITEKDKPDESVRNLNKIDKNMQFILETVQYIN